MAITLGDAIVFIRGDRRPLEDSFDDSERRTKSWTSHLGDTIKTGIGVALGNMATLAAQKVAQLGGALADMVTEALPIEGIRASFTGLTGDAEAALEVLRRGALGMVTDAELMRTYNEAAQLVGETFANQLPDAMGFLSKVSASTGQDMGFMLDSLTKGVGRLSPMILDNLGIQVNLAEANQAYADQLGISVEEMSKAEQQAALMAQVMEKLEQNTAAMPDVTDNAATKMAQFQATLQNLKDGVGVALIPALMALLTPLGDLATKVGPGLIEWAKSAGEWLGNTLPDVIRAVTQLFRGDLAEAISTVRVIIFRTFGTEVSAVFDQWLDRIISVFQSVRDVVIVAVDAIREWFVTNWPIIRETVFTTVDAIREWFVTNWPIIQETVLTTVDAIREWFVTNWPIIRETVLTAVEAIREWFVTNWPIIQAVVMTAWTVIQDVISAVVGVIIDEVWPTLVEAFDVLTEALGDMGITWGDVWNAVKTALGVVAAAIGAILLGIVGAVTGLVQGVAKMLKQLVEFWDEMRRGLIRIVEDGLQWIIGAFEFFAGLLTGDTERMLNGLANAWDGFWEFLKGLVQLIVDGITGPFEVVFEFFKGWVEGIIGFFQNLFDALVGNSIIPEMMAAIKGVFETVLDEIKEIVETVLGALKGIVETKIGEMKTAVETKLGEVKGKFDTVLGQIKSLFSTSTLVQAGVDFVQGLIDGIGSMGDALWQAAQALAQKAIDAILALFGGGGGGPQQDVNPNAGLSPGFGGAGGGFSRVAGTGPAGGQSVVMYGVNIFSSSGEELLDDLLSFQTAVV